MDEAYNPYAPGAGLMPTAFVGRTAELRSWEVGLQRVSMGRTARPMALYGLRGVGKTVLLNRMGRDAEAAGWITAKLEAGSGKSLREDLGESLYAPLAELARPSAGHRILKALRTALSFKASYDSSGTWNFGVDLSEAAGGGADSGLLESDLAKVIKDLSAAAAEREAGLALLIDEAQDLKRAELTALCAVAHQAAQNNWAFLLALAGLPSLPRDVSEAKSYAERLFDFRHITALAPDDAAQAIRAPALVEDARWDDDAVDFVVSQTGGYPYFLQQYGQDTWNYAEGPDIHLTDAAVAAGWSTAALDNGFFRARWDRATPAEKDYLRAMAVDEDGVSVSGEVASRLGREVRSLGPARQKLIDKGLIYAPEHGRIAFTVPRMAEFINRQPT